MISIQLLSRNGTACCGSTRGDFLDAVQSRTQPVASAEIGHRTATICHLNNLAMRLGRTIRWDPDKEVIVGDEEANKFLGPTMRDPWHL